MEADVPLFSRRTRRAVGTKRVISALGLVIWGLALIVAVAFFSMVAVLVSSALGRWIKLGGALRTPGFGMGAGGNKPGGGTKGGRSIPGRGGGIPVGRERNYPSDICSKVKKGDRRLQVSTIYGISSSMPTAHIQHYTFV